VLRNHRAQQHFSRQVNDIAAHRTARVASFSQGADETPADVFRHWGPAVSWYETAAAAAAAGIIIIIIPCKPYLSASATAPHPLGRRKVERLFSLFSV
jgi:hypothetical protein